MKKILVIIGLAVLTFLPQSVLGQENGYWSLQYSAGFATGDLSEFTSKASFRGAMFEYKRAVKENVLVGLDLGWNVFYEQKDYDTYSQGTVSLSGKQYRTQNQIPILVSVDYLIPTGGYFMPYVGLGIGTMYSERLTDMGQWRLEENPWSFAIKPEVGFLYELSYSASFKMAVKYFNGFETEQLATQSYIALSAGFTINF